MPEAVVFDLDDTLYLEREFVHSGFAAVGKHCRAEFGIFDFAQRACDSFSAGIRGTIFNEVLTSYGIPVEADTVAKLVAVYREHSPQIRLLNDAEECLRRLHKKVPLALVTDGPSCMQWNKIRALGIEAIFDAIVVTNDLGPEYGKPHPMAFQVVEEKLGKRGPQLVYVADNPAKDFLAPQQLGWQTIRVRRVDGIYSERECAAVDREIENLWDFAASYSAAL